MASGDDAGAPPRWTIWLRILIGAGAVVVGCSGVVLTLAVGHCSAFGGRCPAEPVPLLEDDVFGIVATIVAVTTAIVAVCTRPDRRGLLTGVAVAAPLGLLVGVAAATLARGA